MQKIRKAGKNATRVKVVCIDRKVNGTLTFHSKNTVELRVFSGSLNEVKIIGCPVKQYGTVHRR